LIGLDLQFLYGRKEGRDMRFNHFLVFMLSLLFLISCSNVTGNTKEKPVQTKIDKTDQAMVKGVRMVGKNLEGLSKEQMASVAALITMTRAATLMEGEERFGRGLTRFWVEMQAICPPLPEDTMRRFGDCRDHELDYGKSMAKCLKKGKSEMECEKENYGSLKMAVQCRMEELEKLNGVILEIPGIDWPDPPIPW